MNLLKPKRKVKFKNMHKNYRANRNEFTKNKGDEIDSKSKLDYRDNLDEPVK